LASPGLLLAQDRNTEEHHQANRTERYYDKDTKTWHEWNGSEQQAYRHWWDESHKGREYREFSKLNAKERAEYWRWRHDHPDAR
jgi:hypothetical protein